MKSTEPASGIHVTEHLANERTFLAWVRTSLGLIGLGFVLARMGLFLRQLAAANLVNASNTFHHQTGREFMISGVALLLIGAIFCAWAGRCYGKNRQAIDRGVYVPAEKSVAALTGLVVVGGLVIAAMVMFRMLFE